MVIPVIDVVVVITFSPRECVLVVFGLLAFRDVNIEFFTDPDIECDNPVKIRISDFIRAA